MRGEPRGSKFRSKKPEISEKVKLESRRPKDVSLKRYLGSSRSPRSETNE